MLYRYKIRMTCASKWMTKLCTIHITHAHCRHCIALESYIIYYVCELSKKVIMSLEIVFVFFTALSHQWFSNFLQWSRCIYSNHQGCKRDVWCRDRDVIVSRQRRDRDFRVTRPRHWSDGIETRPRRQCHQSETRRSKQVSRRLVETFKPWLVVRAYSTSTV